MREIKFRAWLEKDKKMIPLVLMTWIDGKPNTDMILMQYTGLKDKNKKEIYFDDIIEFTFLDTDDPTDSKHGGTAVVTRTMNNGAGILYDWIDFDEGICKAVLEGGEISDLWEDDDLWSVEIIGNIYEDKKLLQ